jgi:hypothetical protein
MPISTAKLSLASPPGDVFGEGGATSALLGYLQGNGPRPNGTSAAGQAGDAVAAWVRDATSKNANGIGGSNSLSLNFPYTPVIRTGTTAQYTEMELTHTNYQPHAFNRSQVQNISIQAQFTSQTDIWAKYSLAAIHFMRTITKMRYGQNDPKRGAPPPVVYFSAYGTYMFENVPVIVQQFNITLPNDVDYVDTMVNSSHQAVPIAFQMDIELIVQRAVGPIRTEFTLGQFSSGALASKGYI